MEIITFEQIYDLARKEKTSEEIQPVNPNILGQISFYLDSKEKIIESSKGKVIEPELEKQRIQLNSARQLAKEFYERRERKVILLALEKSRVHQADTKNLLEHENVMLEDISREIEKHREDTLSVMFGPPAQPYEPVGQEDAKHEKKEAGNILPEKDDAYQELETVRFISVHGRFYGPNLEIYGPFKEGDIANLPKIIVDILLKKEAVRVIGKNSNLP
jgi:hypothetical protein